MQANIPQSDYTVRQVAQILQVTVGTIRSLILNGKLKHYKISVRGTRISQKQLSEFRGE